jgi:hypothetical protein
LCEIRRLSLARMRYRWRAACRESKAQRVRANPESHRQFGRESVSSRARGCRVTRDFPCPTFVPAATVALMACKVGRRCCAGPRKHCADSGNHCEVPRNDCAGPREALRGFSERLRRFPESLRESPESLRGSPKPLRGLPERLRGFPEPLRRSGAARRCWLPSRPAQTSAPQVFISSRRAICPTRRARCLRRWRFHHDRGRWQGCGRRCARREDSGATRFRGRAGS